MTTGTDIIKRSLQKIGAHSAIAPASPASIVLGMEILNSMLELWLSRNIQIGFTPLKVPGDELNETPDSKNAIISNLALSLAPDFDNGKNVVSRELKINAHNQFDEIKRLYQKIIIPNKVVSGTLPVGAGNTRGVQRKTFFGGGAILNDKS